MLTMVHFYLFLQVFKLRKPGIYSKAAHFYAQPPQLVAKYKPRGDLSMSHDLLDE